MQLASNPTTYLSSQLEQIMMQAGLNEGWYVVVPDYEGPKAAFGCGHQAGKAVLNSIRAALQSGSITGINKNAKVTYWGYSGGSIATGWASLLQPTYAPDINSNSVGFALGGIVADVEHTAATNMGSPFAGLIFAAINGLSVEYPLLNDYVNNNVLPEKLSQFRDPKKECLIQTIPEFAFQGWDWFKDGDNTLYDAVVKNVTSQNNMVSSSLVPQAPLFFYNSKFDEIIPASDADDLYSRLCDAGVSIQYNQDLLGGHVTQQVLGSGDAFVWLKDRLNGVPANGGCNRDFTFSNAITPDGLSGLSDVIVTALLRLFLLPLGPNVFLG